MFLLYWLLRLLMAVGAEQAATPVPAQTAAPHAVTAKQVDFVRDVRPILERRCQPCHFEGGKMYAKLPFDRPETIAKLNTKLFSRIRAEEEQQILRAFLASR